MDVPNWDDAPFDKEFDEDLRDRLKAEVDPDEPVLWAGRPVPKPTSVGAGTVFFAALDLALVVLIAACVIRAIRAQQADPSGPIVLATVAFVFVFFITLGLISASGWRKNEAKDRA